MIKAIAATGPGHHLVVLGLSEVNLQRIRAPILEPIVTDLGELDPTLHDVAVAVLWGPTKAERHRMIPALLLLLTSRGRSGRIVVLGVGDDDLATLRRGVTIRAAPDRDAGVRGLEIVLFWGPTEEQMEAALGPLLEQATRIGPGRLPGTGPDPDGAV
jgi:hypothetical protein